MSLDEVENMAALQLFTLHSRGSGGMPPSYGILIILGILRHILVHSGAF